MLTKAREIACTRFEQERTNILSKMHAAETECLRLKEAHKRELDFESRKLHAVIESKDRVIAELEERMRTMSERCTAIAEERGQLRSQCIELRDKVNALKIAIKTLKDE